VDFKSQGTCSPIQLWETPLGCLSLSGVHPLAAGFSLRRRGTESLKYHEIQENIGREQKHLVLYRCLRGVAKSVLAKERARIREGSGWNQEPSYPL